MGDEPVSKDNSVQQPEPQADNQPADWKPYNHEEFSKGLKEVSEMYTSDPERVEGKDTDDTNISDNA